MKVLILGGAGYVGTALTGHLLEHGHDVTVLDLMMFGAESLMPLGAERSPRIVVGDIRDRSLLESIMPSHDAVVLLASIVGEPACNRNPDLTRSINEDGTKTVLEVAKKSGIEKLVFASTCSNYGVNHSEQLVDETAPLMPLSAYSETKVNAERYVLSACSESMCTTVLRLSTAFGVSRRMRFDLLVSDFALHGFRDRKIVIYGEQFWRPFVHIQDIASAIETVLRTPRPQVAGEVFNIGRNDNNVQKMHLAELVSQQLGNVEIETVARNQDPRSYRVSFDKVENKLGFRARWSVEQGIREVLDHLAAHTWQNPLEPRFYN